MFSAQSGAAVKTIVRFSSTAEPAVFLRLRRGQEGRVLGVQCSTCEDIQVRVRFARQSHTNGGASHSKARPLPAKAEQLVTKTRTWLPAGC